LPFAENHHVTLASALSESVAQQIDVFASLYSVELSVKETDKISVGKLTMMLAARAYLESCDKYLDSYVCNLSRIMV
jgi:viroplasmin and RNaseH domain-containing protein